MLRLHNIIGDLVGFSRYFFVGMAPKFDIFFNYFIKVWLALSTAPTDLWRPGEQNCQIIEYLLVNSLILPF